MTEQEQEITIAEACGYKWYQFTAADRTACWFCLLLPAAWITQPQGFDGKEVERPEPSCEMNWSTIPDYLHNKHAVEAAEIRLLTTVQQQDAFCERLIALTAQERITPSRWLLLHATATQHCDALLHALNLWRK